MDLLSELRASISSGRPIELHDDLSVSIAGRTYPGDAVTAYKAASGTYSLAALAFAYLNKGLPATAYIKAALTRKLKFVTVAQRDKLVLYLEGKAEAEGNLDTSVRSTGYTTSAGSLSHTSAALTSGPSSALEAAMRLEVPYKTRYNVLDCGNKALKDDVFKHFFSVQQSQPGAGSGSSKRPAPSTAQEDSRKRARTAPLHQDAILAKLDKEHFTPIILVPPTTSSLVNMFNAEEFFGKGNFIALNGDTSSLDKPGTTKLARVDSKGSRTHFYVVDNVASLKDEDWIRIVAVIAAGPEWQFKGWTWGKPASKDPKTGVSSKEDIPPVKIFDRALGFHFHYEGDPPHPNVAKWSVTPLALSRSKRYADAGVAQKFWSLVDNDIYTRKKFCMPRPAAT